MIEPQPLVIRRSLSNWNYLLQTAFAVGFIIYGTALLMRWPAVATSSEGRDTFLAVLFILIGIPSLIAFSVMPMLDRAPLLQIDGRGILFREIGNDIVPWAEISGCYFDQIHEGRYRYWYFFFTQTDAASGLKFNHKIAADEFDNGNDEVLALVERFQSSAPTRAAHAKSRPGWLGFEHGDALVLHYSPAGIAKVIGIYWLLASIAAMIAAMVAMTMRDDFVSLRYFDLYAADFFSKTETWLWIVLAIVFGLAVIGSAFQLRDLYFRGIALRADRTGLESPALEAFMIPWAQIYSISFEPYARLLLKRKTEPLPVESEIGLLRLSRSQQEIYDALCWLLARWKIRFDAESSWHG